MLQTVSELLNKYSQLRPISDVEGKKPGWWSRHSSTVWFTNVGVLAREQSLTCWGGVGADPEVGLALGSAGG